MRRGWCLWAWVCLSLSYHAHAHSIHTDPDFSPHYHQGEGGGGGSNCEESSSGLSNHIAIELHGGEDQARHLALKHDLHYVRQVFTDPPVFHLYKQVKKNNSCSRGARGCDDDGALGISGRRSRARRAVAPSLIQQLALEPEVKWVEQQKSYVRDKRDQPSHVPVPQFLNPAIRPNSRHTSAGPRRNIPAEVERNRVKLDTILSKRYHVSGSGGRKVRLNDEGDLFLEDWEREKENDWVLENIESTRKKMEKNDGGRTRDLKHDTENLKREEIPASLTHRKGKGMERGEQKIYHHEDKLKSQSVAVPKDNEHFSLASLKKHTKISLLRSLQLSLSRHQQDHRIQDRKQFSPDVVITPSADNYKSSNRQQRVSACRRDDRHTKSVIPGNRNEAEYASHERESGTGSQNHGNEGTATPLTAKDDKDQTRSSWHSMVEFNDPLFKDQWYLVNTGQVGEGGRDLNLTWAWMYGFTGKGVTVSILDDGIQTTNPDIAHNYASDISYSVVQDGQPLDDPSPHLDPPAYTNSHGTYCSGIVAAVANNSYCGIGIAYEARVGGVRIVDGKVTDIQEATALSRHAETVDVFSASWGPTDDGTKVEGPGKLTQQALLYGITKGRGGRGSVYVWAAGNGGLLMDNCNLDGYTSSIYTLSVAPLTPTGTSTFYSEPCASILASIYIGGAHTLTEGLKDEKEDDEKQLRVVVPELDGHCSEKFQGSSAAAPLMAGVVALALQANPELGWRDLQHLVVATAAPTPEALHEDGWATNTRGRPFHLLQGFGAVNAGRLVEAAITWENVAPQKTVNTSLLFGSRPLPPGEWVNLTESLTDVDITSTEHVVVTISLTHPERRLIQIFVVSPGGTQSQILTKRLTDKSGEGFRSWGFMSVHFWGENPRGTWKVAVKSGSGRRGNLKEVHLQVYGI